VALKTTFPEYLWAFTGRWSVLMTSAPSVPAAIAAAFAPNWIARIVFAATAVICFLVSSFLVWRNEREKRAEAETELARQNDPILTGWGNVRVADNPNALELFLVRGAERDKLLSLLTDGVISCWARRMTPDQSDLKKVAGSVWNDAGTVFDFDPKRPDDERTINQTYIRDHANRPRFYDLYLNYTQMRRVWRTIVLTQTKGEVR
jgi:hypothetical protein